MIPTLRPLTAAAAAGLLGGALLGRPAQAQTQATFLRGSRASVQRMYDQARDHRLTFYENSAQLREAIDRGRLDQLDGNDDYRLHQVSFPYVVNTTRLFVERLASQYRSACGEQLVVTSATRPESRQPVNSTAKSVHPTGMAVDLRRPSGRCLTWLRSTLVALEKAGVLEATEEHNPVHFHVAVFPLQYTSYLGDQLEARVASAAPDPAPGRETVRRVARQVTRQPVRQPERKRAAERRYRVQNGDTLWHLARRYGTTVAQLRSLNHLRSSTILPGQTLVLPSGS